MIKLISKYLLNVFVIVWLAGCASTVELPSNAHIVESSSGSRYLHKVDFSYTANKPHDFSQLRLCVAQNVSNNSVALHDVSGSWVGPYTGAYYRNDNYQQVADIAGIFKHVDEKTSTLIAVGTTSATASGLFGICREITQYSSELNILTGIVEFIPDPR